MSAFGLGVLAMIGLSKYRETKQQDAISDMIKMLFPSSPSSVSGTSVVAQMLPLMTSLLGSSRPTKACRKDKKPSVATPIWTVTNKSHLRASVLSTNVPVGTVASIAVDSKDTCLCVANMSIIPSSSVPKTIGQGIIVSISQSAPEWLSVLVETDKHWEVQIVGEQEKGDLKAIQKGTLKAVLLQGGFVTQGDTPLTGVSYVVTPGGKKIKFREADAGVTDGYSWRVNRRSVDSVDLLVKVE